MIPAYDKVYLEKARTALGRMLDFAVHDLKYEANDFFDLFIESGVSTRFETGDYTVLVGMSGIELAYEVLDKSHTLYKRIVPNYTVNRSMEYWLGWALAYYQWETSLSFAKLTQFIPLRDIAALYYPYHEMDIRHFVERMNELYRIAQPETNLKLLRQHMDLSQRDLAILSDIPIRTIQQYEQRQKNINKAQAEYLIRLSRALCCNVEDLIEKPSDGREEIVLNP